MYATGGHPRRTANDPAARARPIQSLQLNDAYDGPGVGGLIGIRACWPAGSMLFVSDAGDGRDGGDSESSQQTNLTAVPATWISDQSLPTCRSQLTAAQVLILASALRSLLC